MRDTTQQQTNNTYLTATTQQQLQGQRKRCLVFITDTAPFFNVCVGKKDILFGNYSNNLDTNYILFY